MRRALLHPGSFAHPRRLLAALAALCSLAIVVAEATIAGALPNMSVVSKALHATSGGALLAALVTFSCTCLLREAACRAALRSRPQIMHAAAAVPWDLWDHARGALPVGLHDALAAGRGSSPPAPSPHLATQAPSLPPSCCALPSWPTPALVHITRCTGERALVKLVAGGLGRQKYGCARANLLGGGLSLLCFAGPAGLGTLAPCSPPTCPCDAPRRLGRFAFYRMVPRHTDAYSLCYSGAT